ncbi:hypothetical protein WI36_26065 [Burkholderia ubonensis]|uniref:hypothetical protein n=1 Tax=Burkholderia ubonensis TaxID=101571 RepID=UPI0007596ED9|nr:hypothetical protein [Burkholderia ubonensis]KUZ65822.1 hypothetical protein WI36_26065 [Burkholderia ubonensis]
MEPLLKSLSAWLSNENIVGLRIGNKITAGKETAQLAIIVSVVRKKTREALGVNDYPIPSTVELHRLRDDGQVESFMVPTDVVETGLIRTASLNERVRPCPGGYQIAVNEGLFGESTGTLGVNTVYGGRFRMLTNKHVIAATGNLGATVYQPDWALWGNALSVVDGSIPVVTYTNRQQPNPVYNVEDLAWCNVTAETASPNIVEIGEAKGIRAPKLHERVRWIGKTTGTVQKAKITSITSLSVIQFGSEGQWAWFKKGITFDAGIVRAGDSGAAIVADSDNYVVGLIHAYDERNNAGTGCRID